MKKIRVALSGSGFRFPAHVGAIAAIQDAGFEIVEVSGTSGGAIVASMVALGVSIENLKDIIVNTDFGVMVEFNPTAIMSYGFCNGSKLKQFLTSIVGKDKRFKDTKVPLHVVSTDLRKSTIVTFNDPEQNIVQALMASAAVPFLYTPVIINNQWLVDGGVVNNTPSDQLSLDDDSVKLAVKLTSTIDTTVINSPMDILCRAASLLFESNDRAHLSIAAMSGAIYSIVNTGSVKSLNSKMSKTTKQQLFNAGYEKTKSVLETFQSTINDRSLKIDYAEINKKIYG